MDPVKYSSPDAAALLEVGAYCDFVEVAGAEQVLMVGWFVVVVGVRLEVGVGFVVEFEVGFVVVAVLVVVVGAVLVVVVGAVL